MHRQVIAMALCFLAACSVTGFEDRLRVTDEEAADLVRQAPFPERVPSVLPEPPLRVEKLPDGRLKNKIDLREALRLALLNNQGFLTQGEALDVQLLTLQVIRHGWQPLISPVTGSVAYRSSPESAHTLGGDSAVTLSQKTPLGGDLAATWSHSGSRFAGSDTYFGTGTVSYTQPLLRGAGVRPALEDLVSAERGYVYTRRFYEFNRLSLLVGTVESYFGLLQRETTIRNFEINLERAKNLADRAIILEQAGQVTRADVFRSQLAVTRAESDLAAAREQLKIVRDAFKIDLGLPPENELEIAPESIEYRALGIGREEAVASALEKNPAVLNARDAVEDARRALAIAENATLPRVDAATSYTWSSDNRGTLIGDYDTADRSFAVLASVEIPIDRFALRRDYQRAVIAYRQVERDYLRTRDDLTRDIQSQLTLLRQAELNMQFEERAIRDAERTLERVQLDYENNRATNRDVIDAQVQLLNAQNAYQQARVSAKISQLRILQFIGRLEADAEGEWLK